MAHRYQKKISAIVGIGAFVLVSWSALAWSGPLKLIMKDGTSVEVSYYWITDGEYKFDIPGGVAGIPRSQVASVHEVLESKEFDPESLMQNAAEKSTADQRKLVQSLVASKSPSARCEEGDLEQELTRLRVAATKETAADKPKIHAQSYRIEKSLPFVCEEAGGPVLVIQEILSSSTDLKGREFNMVLYDSNGNVLSRKQCEVYALTLDEDARKILQVKSHIYLLRASIKPNPNISRYEIAAVRH